MANLSNINNKFIVADSSGQARVSIGNTTTGFPLTINGTSATDIFVVQDTSNNMAHIWTTGASGYAKFGLRDNGTMKTIISAGSDSYFQGGNVGIGTSTPDRSLDVEGSGIAIIGTGGYTELMLRGQVEGTGTVRNVGSWHWSLRSDVGGDNDDLKLLRFVTGSYAAIAMQVDNSNSNITFAGGIEVNQYIRNTTSNTNSNYIQRDSSNTALYVQQRGAGNIVQFQYGAGAIGSATDALTISGTGTSTFTGDIMPAAENAHNIGSAAVRWEDLYVDDGYIRNAYIDEYIYHNGETSNYIQFTTGNFDVYVSSSSKVNIDANKTYLNNNTVLVNNNGGSLVIDGTGASELRMAGPAGYYSFMMSTQVRAANSITWSNLGTDGSPVDDAVSADLMTLKYTGMLGVGTLNPDAMFHCAGTSTAAIRMENTNTAIGSGENYGEIQWEGNDINTSANGIRASIQVKGYGAGTQGETGMYFRTSYIGADSNVDRMTITHLGDVGIGTTSPATNAAYNKLLHINASAGVGAVLKLTDTTSGSGANDGLEIIQYGAESYLINRENGAMFFYANNNPRMTILPAGNVGIGTTSPQVKLHVDGANYNTSSKTEFKITDHGNNYDLNNVQCVIRMNGRYWSGDDNTAVTTEIRNLKGNSDGSTGSIMSFAVQAAGGSTDISGTEAMRITSAGDLLIGTTSTNPTSGFGVKSTTTSTFTQTDHPSGTASGLPFAIFRYNQSEIGSITQNGTSATLFNTSSDYRLKEDLKDFNGLDKVSKIPVYDFKWKVDENRSYGVMAHELQEVLPQAVVGEKDAEEMQQVDYSKIVPLLVKSIQELKAEIDVLKSK